MPGPPEKNTFTNGKRINDRWREVFAGALVAYLKPGEKMSFHTIKVIYNCLPPDLMTQLPKRSSFQGTYPGELQAHVLRSWKEYGI
jgi:hypothetical protein